jgi:hypothetical protein
MSAVERRGVSGSPDDVVGKCIEEGLTEVGRGDGVEEAGKEWACRRGIATVLDRIGNSVGWNGSSEVVQSGCIGRASIRLVPLRPISEDEETRGD